MENAVEIYQTPEGETQIEVKFEQDTVWLSQSQISELFQRDRTVIAKHINNIFKEDELNERLVSANFAHTTQHGAITGKTQESMVKYYNLDVIIAVGYRVNSKRGTQFRQWATQRLKEYLVQGYAINQKRLEQLKKIVEVIQRSGKTENIQLGEAKSLLDILSNYTQSFILLNQYDNNDLSLKRLNENITYEIQYEEAISAIENLKKQLIGRKEASALFGNQKDESFKGTLQSVVQIFGRIYLYPSIEEQAAHLLYFIYQKSFVH